MAERKANGSVCRGSGRCVESQLPEQMTNPGKRRSVISERQALTKRCWRLLLTPLQVRFMERNFAGCQIVDTGFDPDRGCFQGIANNGRGCAQQIGLKSGIV